MAARKKPLEQLRRRNRPDEWVILPAEGCSVPPPRWPLGVASKDEAALWRELWRTPVASWWWEQRTPVSVVARYVSLSISKPEHAQVGSLERELGLTPASMTRLRLTIETPEPEALA